MNWALHAAEKSWLPDPAICWGIRRLLTQRLDSEQKRLQTTGGLSGFVTRLDQSPLAVEVDKANEQHYELPASFFELMLGPHRKYSSAYWHADTRTLGQAEEAMLALSCERAQLENGQEVLELGCGWGSLSLWMASHYPASTILTLSNSHSQRKTIERLAQQRGLTNLEVMTCDINDFQTDSRFDRVVSVEMFEHTRNWRRLLGQVASWLQPQGRAFLHVFSHRDTPYLFEQDGETDWMARYFFSGGLMPSHRLMHEFEDTLQVEEDWQISGLHYTETLLAWLALLDENRDKALPILSTTYGKADAKLWLQRWRMFLLACAELFRYDYGSQWQVSHYRLRQPGS